MVAEHYSALSHLDCGRCHGRYDATVPQNTCTCGGPLQARYHLGRASDAKDKVAARRPSLWRYHELLPVASAASVVSLGEGMTPLVPMSRLGRALGVPRLLMKDDGLLPTATFKARGAAVGISRARELGASGVALPSNGNAGAAWAVYAARAGMRCLVAMPTAAPEIARSECAAAGAEYRLVDGLIGDAGAVVRAELAARPGWFDVSTLREPYRLEGKKTIGLEIAEQLGWRVPDVIVCPTGGGVGLIAVEKALRELRELGWIGPAVPRLVAVQAAAFAPIVAAFELGVASPAQVPASPAPAPADGAEPRPGTSPTTVAFGLTVPAPLGGVEILAALRATNGTAIAVTDEELLASQRQVGRLEGTWVCPEGAACFAAVGRLRASGWLNSEQEVVVLNTGSGLKYPHTIPADGSFSADQ